MKVAAQNPWLRMTVEGAVIVAGILTAFAVDAWWDEHKERMLEQETLVSLQAEFRDHRELLQHRKRNTWISSAVSPD
jgi:hypothetical protein